MLPKLFDEYSLNARVKPALLALLPIVVMVYVFTPSLYSIISALFSVVVACGFITALAHYSRYQGAKTEKRLYKSWGGKPTTIILRHTDDLLDNYTKLRYHKYLSKSINDWSAPTIEDEMVNITAADKYYDSAVKWLLEKTRNTKIYDLLFKENISYGFRRNSRGIKWLGVSLASFSIAMVISIILMEPKYFDIQIVGLEVGALIFSIIMLLWWLFIVTDVWVRDAAERYAIRLLAVCENKT